MDGPSNSGERLPHFRGCLAFFFYDQDSRRTASRVPWAETLPCSLQESDAKAVEERQRPKTAVNICVEDATATVSFFRPARRETSSCDGDRCSARRALEVQALRLRALQELCAGLLGCEYLLLQVAVALSNFKVSCHLYPRTF